MRALAARTGTPFTSAWMLAGGSESGAPAAFLIHRTGPADRDLDVFFRMAGDATEGADYELLDDRVVIPRGYVSTTLWITVLDDEEVEDAETIALQLVARPAWAGRDDLAPPRQPTTSATSAKSTTSGKSSPATRPTSPDSPTTRPSAATTPP